MLQGYSYVEYKYIKKDGTKVIWASGPNWSWRAPDAGDVTLSDQWR